MGAAVAAHAAIGRLNPPRVGDGPADGQSGAPIARMSPHPRRVRIGLNVAGPVGQVVGVLRFPAVLLGVILLFLALQQRADRHEPKLASAPVQRREETLEFR
jgi:hypothetical protein